MALPYFPVDMSAMSAKRKFKEVDGGDSFNVGENKITARWLNHPQGCLGFRIETPAGVVAYATDNEPGDAKLDESLRELAAGADIFINDAQFTTEQLETTRKGWGQSSWLGGTQVAGPMGAVGHHGSAGHGWSASEELARLRGEDRRGTGKGACCGGRGVHRLIRNPKSKGFPKQGRSVLRP